MVKQWEASKESYLNTLETKLGPTREISQILVKLVGKRLELGMTQKELAEKSGLKQSAIARLENFSVLPRLDTLIKTLRAMSLELTIIDKTKEDIFEVVVERAERTKPYKTEPIYEQLLKTTTRKSRTIRNTYNICEGRKAVKCKTQLMS